MKRRPTPHLARKMKRRQLIERIRNLNEANRATFPGPSSFPMPVSTHRIETLTIDRVVDDRFRRHGYNIDDLLAMAERDAIKLIAHKLMEMRFVEKVPAPPSEGYGFRYILRVVDPQSL